MYLNILAKKISLLTLFSVYHISLTPHHNRHFISTHTDNFQQKYPSNTKKIIISVNAVRNDTSIPRGERWQLVTMKRCISGSETTARRTDAGIELRRPLSFWPHLGVPCGSHCSAQHLNVCVPVSSFFIHYWEESKQGLAVCRSV